MAINKVFQFYAELEGFENKIWRRFEISGNKSVVELGCAIQVMFEMTASHLFCIVDNFQEERKDFLIRIFGKEGFKSRYANYNYNENYFNTKYELPIGGEIYLGDNEILADPTKSKIKDLKIEEGSKLTFEYDYGDGWIVNLVLEKLEKREISLKDLPHILDGQGFGIIEDVGGPGGLKEFAEIMARGKGKEYEEFSTWYGRESFNIEKFEIDDINYRLKRIVKIYRRIYEEEYYPNKKEFFIIDRHYKE